MPRRIVTGLIFTLGLVLAGCGAGVSEIKPPQKAPDALAPDESKKRMEESLKHMPPGTKLPPNMPTGK